jgi:hypothetical protein
MPRRVFFSFNYERDFKRAAIVRDSWANHDRQAVGFWGASLWTEANKRGDGFVKKMILRELENTSVTVVLIGAESVNNPWINLAIMESYKQNHGVLGLYIDKILDSSGDIEPRGGNPLDYIFIKNEDGSVTHFSKLYLVYDYMAQNGYLDFQKWIEFAAQRAGK